jgi:hypothetical protein
MIRTIIGVVCAIAAVALVVTDIVAWIVTHT